MDGDKLRHSPVERFSILVVHNRYQQAGGEDAVVRSEVKLLRRAGHRVVQYVRHNRDLVDCGVRDKMALAASLCWSINSYREIANLVDQVKPDVAHFHNLFPLISPSAYYACKRAGCAVVQTLHNYRFFCPAGTCFHSGKVCTACDGSFVPGLRRGCYRGSRAATAAMAGMLRLHQVFGTWTDKVDAYIAPSRFCREFAIARGLPEYKVRLKPHFLLRDEAPSEDGEYAMFAGRLSEEKGVLALVRAWTCLKHIPLLIVGDGPLASEARSLAAQRGACHIRFVRARTPEDVAVYLRKARFLVMPSQCNETFGMVLLEAASAGVPVLATRVGALPEIVQHGVTGLLFPAASETAIADTADWAWSHRAEMQAMGLEARRRYQRQFTAECNLPQLLDVYRFAIAQNSRS